MREAKKWYQKPILERVVLIPEENVLGVCHQGSGTGVYPGGSLCASICPSTTKIMGPPLP